MLLGAIILCGGHSTRMGRDKATLPFGPELMLQRIVRLLGEVVPSERIVVVAAKGQELPTLPATVRVTRDEIADRGPLEGLYAGLLAHGSTVDAVFVTACDVPLLEPQFVAELFARLQGHQIVVPRLDEFYQPLSAVYRVGVLEHVARLRDERRMAPRFLFDAVDTLALPVDELRAFDPNLGTLLNLNCPEDYHAALSRAGYTQSQQDSV